MKLLRKSYICLSNFTYFPNVDKLGRDVFGSSYASCGINRLINTDIYVWFLLYVGLLSRATRSRAHP